MARRGYSTATSYRRPRTKIYDSNYCMGEAAYRSAIDMLDKKQFGRVTREEPPMAPPPAEERISPPRRNRPLSAAEIESTWDGPGPAPRLEEAEPSFDQLMERIKAARARTSLAAEQSYDSAFTLRREDVKKRFAEKMLDTVGINEEPEERRFGRPQVMMEDPKWPAIMEMSESAAELAAKARARQSRARLADIDAEMADMEQRGAARDRRAAAVRQLLSSSEQQADSIKISKKVTTVSEKRSSAY